MCTVLSGYLVSKVSHSEGLLREKEAPPNCLAPWTWFWRLGWFSTVSLWHTDNTSYLVILIFWDLENQSYLDWDTLYPTFKYVILLHLQAGFCICWKNPASECPDWSLEGRAICSEFMNCDNKSFESTAGASGLTHRHMEILAHWAFIFPDQCGPLSRCLCRSQDSCSCFFLSVSGISVPVLTSGPWAAC